MLFDAGKRGMVEVDYIQERWFGPVGVIRAKDGEKMPFDAGRHGTVMVDQVEFAKDRTIGTINPDDIYRKITYDNWGKQGCAVVICKPPADTSPEAHAQRVKRIRDTARRIMSNPRWIARLEGDDNP